MRRLLLVLACVVSASYLFAEDRLLWLPEPESPLYYQYVLVAGDDLRVDGGAAIVGNIRSNADLDLQNLSVVDGNAEAVGTISNQGEILGEIVEGAPQVVFPELPSIEVFRAEADTVHEGNVVFHDPTQLEGLVFVEGNAHFKDTLEGPGTLVVGGELRIDSLGANGGPLLKNAQPMTLLTFSDFRLGLGRQINAVVRAVGDASLERESRVDGVLHAEGRVRVKGDAVVSFVDFDTLPPVIEIIEPADGAQVSGTQIHIEARWEDELSGIDRDTARVFLDGEDRTVEAEIDAEGLVLDPPENLAEGGHTIRVEISDRSENQAFAVSSFSMESSPPEISILEPSNEEILDSLLVVVSGQVEDEGGLSTLVVGGRSLEPRVGPFRAAIVLSEGEQTVTAVATDQGGKSSEASVSFIIDVTPPEIHLDSPPDSYWSPEGSVLVEGVVQDATLESLSIDGQVVVPDAEGRFSTEWTVPDAEYVLEVVAVDRAGNTSRVNRTVRHFTVPEVSIASPANLSAYSADTVEVVGTVSADVDSVVVGDQVAQMAGETFSAVVTLREGSNLLTATAYSTAGYASSDTITVYNDTVAPWLAVEEPAQDAFIVGTEVLVRGTVLDPGARGVSVRMDGAAVEVDHGTFGVWFSADPGAHELVIEAVDAGGNSTLETLRFVIAEPEGSHLVAESGNGQKAEIGTELDEPLVVKAVDVAGSPAVGVPVVFRVEGTDGVLGDGGRKLLAQTNAEGLASARFTLGTRAGIANHRVFAGAVGYGAEVGFSASADPGPPASLVKDAGDNQQGQIGTRLPEPIVAVVVDRGFNRLAGIEVEFEIFEGDGVFPGVSDADGRVSRVVTDGMGRAVQALVLGSRAGTSMNAVKASLQTAEGPQIVGFTASAFPPGPPEQTAIAGVVLDETNGPLEGVTVGLHGTDLETQTDEDGSFLLSPVPIGTHYLDIDGSTATRPGPWPHLQFRMVTFAGHETRLDRPIYMLPLDVESGSFVSETQGATVTAPEVPGLALEIAPGSATFPDGSREGVISITRVNSDRVPMMPNFGQQPRLIFTVQPGGTLFDPPARMTLPNVDGLAPGTVTEMYSYDHDQERFITIGRATVSDDGLVVTSNPGGGLRKAGWFCGGNPFSLFGSSHDCPDCQTCNGISCEADASQNTLQCVPEEPEPCGVGHRCAGGECKATDTLKVERVEGPCVAPVDQQVVFGAIANAPNLVRWLARQGTPGSGSGQTFGTSFADLGTFKVLAGCPGGGGSNKTATIEIAVSCEAEPVRFFNDSGASGSDVRPGFLGHFRPDDPEFTISNCARDGEWCPYLEKVNWGNLTVDIQDDPGGRPVFSFSTFEADKDLIQANCEAIIADFTPSAILEDGWSGGVPVPASQSYSLAEAGVSKHEALHKANWKRIMVEEFTDKARDLVREQSCSGCMKGENHEALLNTLDGLFYTEVKEQMGGSGNEPPFEPPFELEEARVYRDTNGIYRQFIDLIRDTARREGWGRCE